MQPLIECADRSPAGRRHILNGRVRLVGPRNRARSASGTFSKQDSSAARCRSSCDSSRSESSAISSTTSLASMSRSRPLSRSQDSTLKRAIPHAQALKSPPLRNSSNFSQSTIATSCRTSSASAREGTSRRTKARTAGSCFVKARKNRSFRSCLLSCIVPHPPISGNAADFNAQ